MTKLNLTFTDVRTNVTEEKSAPQSPRSTKTIWQEKINILKNPDRFKEILSQKILKINQDSTFRRKTSLCNSISSGKPCTQKHCFFAHNLIEQIAHNFALNPHYKSAICNRNPCYYHPQDKCKMVHNNDIIHDLETDTWTIYSETNPTVEAKQFVDRESSPIIFKDEESALITQCTDAYRSELDVPSEPIYFNPEHQDLLYASFELPAASRYEQQFRSRL